jgi:hypothetical protein
MFLSMSCYIRLSLQDANRNATGMTKSKKLATDEQTKADSLRLDVCSVLRKHRLLLIEMSSKMSFSLDKNVDSGYVSLDDQIEVMALPSTYVGNLELLAAAFRLRPQIILYCASPSCPSTEEYEVAAKMPTSMLQSSIPICLYHESDTRKKDGHFDLLLRSRGIGAVSPDKTFGFMHCSESDKRLTFEKCLRDHTGLTGTPTDNLQID